MNAVVQVNTRKKAETIIERGYIMEVEQITRNGLKWFYQEFDRPDGQLEAVNLYDENGDFVREFDSYEDMTAYIDRQ